MTHGKTPDDSELQALYRAAAQAAGDEPDPQLDARILAAARAVSGERRARRQRPPAAWWKRWLVPVSVTAVAVLGVSLTLRVNDEQAALEAARQMSETPPAGRSESAPPEVAEPDSTALGAARRTDRSAEKMRDQSAEKATDQSATGSPAVSAKALPDAATARPAPATIAPKKEWMPEPASPSALPTVKPAAKSVVEPPPLPVAPPSPPRDLPAEFGASFEKKARRKIAPSAPAPAAFGQAPSPPLDDGASQAAKANAELRESSARRARAIESDQALSVGGSASGVIGQSLSPARQNEETAVLEASPERWLEKIRALRRANRLLEAKQELDRFRLRYPDFALPADLK